MKKKKMNVFAFLMTGVFLLSGCSLQDNASENRENADEFSQPVYEWKKSYPDALTVWGVYPDLERSYIEKAFERYESLTGNRLKISQFPQDEFEDRMLSVFRGQEERPDIVLSYGGTNIEQYDPDKNFYDFTGEPWVEDLTDTSINQTIYNGRIIGLPHWEASVSGTIYNKKIFDRYGLELPRTQEEFLEVCQTLLDKGVTPLYMPCREISMLLYQFPMDFLVEDPQVLEELNEGKITYGDLPGMKEVVRWYKTMAEKGYLGKTYLTDDWAGMGEAMSSGDYAMMLCWDTWLYTDFTGDPENFGLMPAFVGLPREGTFEGPNLALFIVNQESGRLESALNFITFLADPYNYNAAFEGIYTAPVFKNQVRSISTPQYQESERLIERNFRDSTAWLRIRGFSQMDAAAIIEYMEPESGLSEEECLRKMDLLRNERLGR